MQKYRSVFISDLHLGAKMSQVEEILKFLPLFNCEYLYLVGDIIDIWALQRNKVWPPLANKIVQQILKKADKGTKIIYVPGNHDDYFRQYCDIQLKNMFLTKQYIHTTAAGKKYLILHGDEFDFVMNDLIWLAHLGGWSYDVSISVNTFINKLRRLFGLPYFSLSTWLKYKVKQAIKYVGKFENHVVNYALSKNVDGAICGHIHFPNDRIINNIHYLNCGDWCETCSFIVEHLDGRLEVKQWKLSL